MGRTCPCLLKWRKARRAYVHSRIGLSSKRKIRGAWDARNAAWIAVLSLTRPYPKDASRIAVFVESAPRFVYFVKMTERPLSKRFDRYPQ